MVALIAAPVNRAEGSEHSTRESAQNDGDPPPGEWERSAANERARGDENEGIREYQETRA